MANAKLEVSGVKFHFRTRAIRSVCIDKSSSNIATIRLRCGVFSNLWSPDVYLRLKKSVEAMVLKSYAISEIDKIVYTPIIDWGYCNTVYIEVHFTKQIQ